ncbi:MAG: hypothetical protein LBH58_05745 [Tannerellaceae bacterium]|jgi:hypothetical protein|nr:hypothetical protein [Tannerellaceae bacterium]
MAMDSDFVEAVKSSNLRLVRIKLGNIIAIDPTLKTFIEMREYAERYMPALYELHDGELNWEPSAWSKDYFNNQQSELSFNFSRKRLDLLCSMVKDLYTERINSINEKRKQESENGFDTVKNFVGTVSEIVGEAIEGIGKWLKDMGHDIRKY